MATLLDVGLFEHFGPVFTFLLIFVIVYGVLTKAKFFGDETESLNAIIAISLAAITMFFAPAVDLIAAAAPWFVFLLIFTFFVLLVIMGFGIPGSQITDIMKKDKVITWVIVSFSIAILLLSLSQVFGSYISGGEEAENEFNQDLRDVIFHPKIMGAAFILLVAAFAIKLLSSTAS